MNKVFCPVFSLGMLLISSLVWGWEYSAPSYGIFSATADWGSAESLPQRGEFKIPGRVEVTETDAGFVYDIYGNGNDIWDINDEGFFVYAEKSGSWSLSARVEWIDRGNEKSNDPWSKIGPMIRDRAKETGSKEFYTFLRSGFEPPYGTEIDTNFRSLTGQYATSAGRTSSVANGALSQRRLVYLRATRLANYNLFYSEWSDDGVTWIVHYAAFIEMGDNAAYGLAITNHADNELLAHARCADVRIEPATGVPAFVWRRFPRKFYERGKPFAIDLEIVNANERERKLTVEESIPESWTAGNVSHGGVIQEATVSWAIAASPGVTLLSYQVTTFGEGKNLVLFEGKSGSYSILGENQASLLLTEMRGEFSHLWRYWSDADGLETVNRRNLFVSADGVVLTNKKEGEYARIDGYTVATIPAQKTFVQDEISVGQILPVESSFGEIWSVSYEQVDNEIQTNALLRFEDGQWIPYTAGDILPTTQSVALIPGASDEVYLRLPDHIVRYNAKSRKTSVVRKMAEWNNGQSLIFKTVKTQSRDGSYWMLDGKGLVRMILPTPWNEISAVEWKEYPFDPKQSVKDAWLPIGNDRVGVTFLTSNGSVERFDGQNWEVVNDLIGVGNNFGYTDENGVLWYSNYNQLTFMQAYPSSEPSAVNDELLAGNTTDIAADPGSGFWAASQRGVAKCSNPLWDSPREISKFNDTVPSIYEDEMGNLWFLSRDRLIRRDSSGGWKFYVFPYQGGMNTYFLGFPRSGKMPVGAFIHNSSLMNLYFDAQREEYVLELDDRGWPYHYFENREREIQWMTFEDYEEKRWLIFRRDGNGEKKILEFDINVERPRIVGEEENGDFWLTTKNEIRLYRGDEYQSFGPDRGYDLPWCANMIDLGGGRKWCGGDELLEFDGRSWKVVRNGLGNINRLLMSSDGCVWIAASVGLWKYVPAKEANEPDVWLQFGMEEGLSANGVYSVFEDGQKRIWAGTSLGICLYNPNADRDCPETIIKKEEYVNRIAEGTTMRVGFAGVDRWKYTDANRLLYSTRLDDGPWSPFTSNTVYSATGLDAGDYLLSVRAIDRNGNIDPIPATFNFSVLPDWYKQPAFIAIMIGGSILIIVLAHSSTKHYLQLRRALCDVNVANNSLNAANAELQEANAQLIQLDQMKSQFVSQASHDLRTPLTAIKGSLDNLMMGIAGDLNDKQARIMERATKSVDRLTNLINDVLDLNRIETGRIVLEKTDIPFKTLVENIINENRPAAEQKRIQLSFVASEGNYTLPIDGGKMERVVGELVGNAIKYTPAGGTLHVSLNTREAPAKSKAGTGETPAEPSAQTIILSVRDTGIGMTPEECAKIWERFYRTAASRKFAKGSGLGLSIAKELVELHSGTITVTSRLEEGTTFTLTLPKEEIKHTR